MMEGTGRLRGVFRSVVMLLALTTLGVGTAASQSALVPTQWSAILISEGESLKPKDPVDLAVSDGGEVAVAWARETEPGISVRHRQESGWTWQMDRYPPPESYPYAWSPTLAYSGTQRMDVWLEGNRQFSCNQPIHLRSPDGTGGFQDVGEKGYYNALAPPLASIAAGPSGWHLVFSAAPSTEECSQGSFNLYYAERRSLETRWLTPTVVITHGAVISNTAVGGGVAYPHIALSPDGETLHIVWEQREQFAGADIHASAWYISGTLSPGGAVTWSPPVRVSPEIYPRVVRPDVAIASDGRVHVVWTRVEGKFDAPTGQYLYHNRLPDGALYLLTEQPIAANKIFPKYVSTSVTTHGDTVCAAWHGYSATQQGSGREDIHLICSEDGGEHWGLTTNVSHSAEYRSVFPRIAFSPSGSLHATWVEYALKDEQWEPYSVFYGPAFRILMPLVLRSG